MANVAGGASCSAGKNATTTGESPQGSGGDSICLSWAGDLALLSAAAFGFSSLGAVNSHCHNTEALLQACPVPESCGRLCCGCWPPAPGSLSPATHPQARPRPNSLATGWRWLSLGWEGFCQFVIKSQHYSCQH